MIRELEPKDRELYAGLSKEFYSSPAVSHQVPDGCRERSFDEMMRGGEYLLGYIIESDGKPAGYAMLAKTFSPEVGGMCIWLEEIYIRPEFQGRGLGKEFFKYLFEHFDGCAYRYRLEAVRDNERALSLYKKLGFKELDYLQLVRDREEL